MWLAIKKSIALSDMVDSAFVMAMVSKCPHQRIWWSPNSWYSQTHLLWQYSYHRFNQFRWCDCNGSKSYRINIMEAGHLGRDAGEDIWKDMERVLWKDGAESGSMMPRTKGHPGLWGAGRHRKNPSPRDSKKHGPTHTSISDSCLQNCEARRFCSSGKLVQTLTPKLKKW